MKLSGLAMNVWESQSEPWFPNGGSKPSFTFKLVITKIWQKKTIITKTGKWGKWHQKCLKRMNYKKWNINFECFVSFQRNSNPFGFNAKISKANLNRRSFCVKSAIWFLLRKWKDPLFWHNKQKNIMTSDLLSTNVLQFIFLHPLNA